MTNHRGMESANWGRILFMYRVVGRRNNYGIWFQNQITSGCCRVDPTVTELTIGGATSGVQALQSSGYTLLAARESVPPQHYQPKSHAGYEKYQKQRKHGPLRSFGELPGVEVRFQIRIAQEVSHDGHGGDHDD